MSHFNAKRIHHLRYSTPKQIEQINQHFLKNISDFLPQYIFWKDIHSVYLGCNQNYARLVGFNNPEEIVGKTDLDLPWQIMGHGADTFQKADQETISGHPITNQEEILSLPNGKTLITLVSKKAIRDEKGTVLGIVGYFTDITLLKQKEKELMHAKKAAEAANQAKSAFIANMRHSIITPLSGLIGMIKILSDEARSANGKLAAQNAFHAAERLLDLLNEVIEIARIESGTLPVYTIRFSLKDLMDTVIKLIAPAIQEKNLKFQAHYDEKLPLYFSSDAIRIHRILLNLLSNAIKFTDKGAIKLNFMNAGQKDKKTIVKISVHDTGIGIPLEKQTQIFTRFTRLTPAYQGVYTGSGLGLAVVKQFAAELEGEIDVKSIPHQGTTFTCVLPLEQALINEPSGELLLKDSIGSCSLTLKSVLRKTFSPNKSHTDKQSVLLVEDDGIAQFSACHQLEKLSCEVRIAPTGEAAIVLVQKHYFDLILMDIGLPGINGMEATQQIRQLERSAKSINKHHCIVALSAHIDEQIKTECLAAGMDAVFSKPFSAEKYLKILNQLN